MVIYKFTTNVFNYTKTKNSCTVSEKIQGEKIFLKFYGSCFPTSAAFTSKVEMQLVFMLATWILYRELNLKFQLKKNYFVRNFTGDCTYIESGKNESGGNASLMH